MDDSTTHTDAVQGGNSEWDALTPEQHLAFILTNDSKATWFQDEHLKILAKFWDSAQHRGGILETFTSYYGKAERLEAAIEEFRDRQKQSNPQAAPAHAAPERTIWDEAESIADFLAHEDTELEADARDLVVPGCSTIIAAPRGTQKSIVTLGLVAELATGGIFRGERVPQRRVLLLDRDNPGALIRKRIRSYAIPADATIKILGREKAPPLTDKAAWAKLPVEHYDVVVIDSMGSFTEGISEKEGRQTQEFLAVIVDLAQRGPAILVLDNTDKAGASMRGRGEKGDRVDIVYEMRNITNWTPPDPERWWEQLPEAGEHAWQQRASRQTNADVTRVALIPSKFRIGIQPEPFVLQIDMRGKPWRIEDVTDTFEQEVSDNAANAEQEDRLKNEAAERALVAKLRERSLLKGDAETFLQGCGLTQRQARNLLNAGNRDVYPTDGRWTIREDIGTRGKPKRIYLAGEEDSDRNNHDRKTPSNDVEEDLLIPVIGSTAIQQKSDTLKPAETAEKNSETISVAYKQDATAISSHVNGFNTTQNEMAIISVNQGQFSDKTPETAHEETNSSEDGDGDHGQSSINTGDNEEAEGIEYEEGVIL